MLIEVMRGLAIFYYWTWFVWPFALIFSFAKGLVDLSKGEPSYLGNLLWAAVSLLLILAGVVSPSFY